MLILSIRTDKPEAELGLFDDQRQLAYLTWQAHRELSVTLHAKIDELLQSQDKILHDIQGIVCFKGPGSFTGLRIGLSVANALAYALPVPIVATEDPDWLPHAITSLITGQNDKIVLPTYGSPVHTTAQRK
jgi:tRNA threonylcarbamoyladenosine biosynthesis protein TsaB